MKKLAIQVVFVLLTLCWMVMIFGFSAQSGEESGGLSSIISRPVTNAIAAWWENSDPEELYLQVDSIVRNAAHFTEYAILGFLLMMALQKFGHIHWWLPLSLGTVYAILDEWHQAYSPGRVSDPIDVLIDACGVFCGVMITHFIINRRGKYV